MFSDGGKTEKYVVHFWKCNFFMHMNILNSIPNEKLCNLKGVFQSFLNPKV